MSWLEARFLEREKRFTVHAELPDGTRVLAHTNNTGRMTGCVREGGRCWLSRADNPRRKLPYTLEVTESPTGVLVGVNTATPSRLVAEAVAADLWPELAGRRLMRREVRYPEDLAAGSRADLLLDGPCWVEIKNVTWTRDGVACFPDAPTARGRKHLRDLMACVASGQDAALIFCVQRGDARVVAPAQDVDPEYADLLVQAAEAGVLVLALRAEVGVSAVRAGRPLPVVTGGRPRIEQINTTIQIF